MSVMKRPRRIDLNLFRVFDAIYQEGSLTRAGEVLHLTQPAVSNALSRLRAAYDDPLFVRTAAGMVPTPVAETIVADIRGALQLLDDTLQPGEAFDPRRARRRFRLSAGDQTAALLAPRLLRLIAAGHSNKMIARALGVSPHTVKRHVANILDKLGARSRSQAAAWLLTQQ